MQYGAYSSQATHATHDDGKNSSVGGQTWWRREIKINDALPVIGYSRSLRRANWRFGILAPVELTPSFVSRSLGVIFIICYSAAAEADAECLVAGAGPRDAWWVTDKPTVPYLAIIYHLNTVFDAAPQ